MGENDTPKTAPCYFCRRQFDVGEFFCNGCHEVICEECPDPECSPWGEHHPEDHKEED